MADGSDKPLHSERPQSQEPPQHEPHHSPRTQAGKAVRQARLAAELRRNLLKRKRQQRARDGRTPQGG
jgi:hypothetical protein